MEPNYFISNLLNMCIPFLCYYLGIFIRKKVWPGKNSLSLGHQFLLGIPVSLIVVSPLLPVIDTAYKDIPALLITLGIIVEHGMLVNETLSTHLKNLINRT